MNELKVDSVVHSFGERRILSDIFLSLQTGEIVGLLGRNGCGKSTLLKIIFGSFKADHGVIHINGNFLKKTYTKKLVAYLPQHDFLPKDLSVKKAFSIYVENPDVRERVMHHDMFRAIHNSRIRTLSGGMLRFLEIILILHMNRPFLLLDEPFTGLSPLYRELVHEYLADIQAEKGIMITDHDYRNVIDISDRLILMKNGRTIPLGNHEELIDYSYVPEGKTL